MSEYNTLSQLMESASVLSTDIIRRQAVISFDITGDKNCKDLMTKLNEEPIVEEFFDYYSDELNDDSDDDDEDDYKLNLEKLDDFFDNAKIECCFCSIVIDIEAREAIKVYMGMKGTYKGEAFNVDDIELEHYEIFLDPEDVVALLSEIENRRVLDEITADNYEKEISNLFWCDAVESFFDHINKQVLPYLKDTKGGVKHRLCDSENTDSAPKWDDALRYRYLNVSSKFNDKYDQIYNYCMAQPDLHLGKYAGNKYYSLTLSETGDRVLAVAVAGKKDSKPCRYQLTPAFESVMKLLNNDRRFTGVKVRKAHIDVEERYTLKKTGECEVVKNSREDLTCPGCSYKLGLFSKYSDFSCNHGIFVSFYNK